MRRGDHGTRIAAQLLLAGGLVLPLTVEAQSQRCEQDPPPVRAFARGWYVLPQAGVSNSDGLFVLGWPRYRFSLVPGTDSLRADSAFVGLQVGTDDSIQEVPVPTGGHGMRDPRVVVTGTGLTVLHTADRGVPVSGLGTSDSLTLFARTWTRSGWGAAILLSAVERSAAVDRGISSDVATYAGELVWIMPHRGSNAHENLLEARVSAGRGSARVHRTAVNLVAYSDVLATPSGLFAALTTAFGDTVGQTIVGMNGIWLYSFENDRWTARRRLISERDAQFQQPRLFSSREGLIVAYREPTAKGSLMRWRPTDDERADWQSIPIVGQLQRGQQEWTDVVSVATTDTTALVLRLRSTGADTLAHLATTYAFPPLVTGTRDAPVAVTMRHGRDRAVPIEMVRYDLRCITSGRAGGPRR